MNKIIEINDIYKIYNPGINEVRALDGLSLNVYEGEFLAIVGYSGSGKTTLMNMLGCLDIPSGGRYCLGGADVNGFNQKQLSEIRSRKIGFIFQSFNLITGLTALENVELPLIYRRERKSRRREIAIQSLEMVELADRLHHKPGEMSGGQQQRVAIARAIAAQPPIIMADEPTGNLDTKSADGIMQILKRLNRRGHTVILITHDDSVAAFADRTVRVQDGKIMGTCREN